MFRTWAAPCAMLWPPGAGACAAGAGAGAAGAEATAGAEVCGTPPPGAQDLAPARRLGHRLRGRMARS
ncbi:hypothetical protein AB0K87_35330, partial [Streptomyces sp. NPDC053705]